MPRTGKNAGGAFALITFALIPFTLILSAALSATFGSAFGQTLSPDVPVAVGLTRPQAASQTTQRFLDEKVALWRQRLKLENWRISAVLTRRADLAPQTLGGISWDKSKKSAVILVLDPADYALPYGEMLNDMELTVVHELIHLELTSLPRSEAHRSVTEEKAVSGIAGAMLELDRRKP
jgi:hypothetical protein